MKDHEIAILVNSLNKRVRQLCPDAPQQLREALRNIVVQHGHEHKMIKSYNSPFDATYELGKAAVKTMRVDLIISLRRFIQSNPDQDILDKGTAAQIVETGESGMCLEGLIIMTARAGLNPVIKTDE